MVLKFEVIHLPKGSIFSKSYGLCRATGHNRMKSQQLFERFDEFPILLSNISQRKKLAMSLDASEFNGYPLFYRSFEDEISEIKEFPKKVKYLVIHTRFLINQRATSLFSEYDLLRISSKQPDLFPNLKNSSKPIHAYILRVTYKQKIKTSDCKLFRFHRALQL